MSVASEQASIALTVDVSGSMRAEDVKPTRLGAAQEAVRRFLDELPDKYRVGLVTFSSRAVRRGAADARPRARPRRAATSARRSAGEPRSATRWPARSSSSSPSRPTATARLVRRAPAPPAGSGPAAVGDPAPLGRRADARHARSRSRARARAKSYGIPVYTVALGTPNGVIDRGGFVRPVPPDPVTLRQIARDDRRRVLRDPGRGAPERRLRGPRLAARAEAASGAS